MDISSKKVVEGYEKAKKHVKTLLDSSHILYDSKQYSISLPLSILAREEFAKLLIIQNKLKLNEGMMINEWKQFTKNSKEHSAHLFRLTFPSKITRESSQKLSREEYDYFTIEHKRLGLSKTTNYEQVKQLTSAYEKSYEKFDDIKQKCLYLDWKGKWYMLQYILDPTELQGLAYTHLLETKSSYYSAISIRIHNTIKTPVSETLKDDLNFQTWLKKEMESPKGIKWTLLAKQAMTKIKNL